MPYGNLLEQAVQRFASYEDLDLHACSIEEREEYEPHLAQGAVVYAGVDYEAILREAEKEVDVVLWDGGNNDLPFFKSDLAIVVVDPHRPGHELNYHPGEANVRSADLVIINKIDTAAEEDIQTVRENVALLNPAAEIIDTVTTSTHDQRADQRQYGIVTLIDGQVQIAACHETDKVLRLGRYHNWKAIVVAFPVRHIRLVNKSYANTSKLTLHNLKKSLKYP